MTRIEYKRRLINNSWLVPASASYVCVEVGATVELTTS